MLSSSMLGKRSVFLIGPMGSGKTAVGRALARMLDYPFLDSDHEIELRSGADASDLSLVRRAQSGHRGAFDLLVRKYQSKVLSVARRYARHPQLAEDIAQETLIRAYRGLAQFRGESSFYTWLYRITVNSARMEENLRQGSLGPRASVIAAWSRSRPRAAQASKRTQFTLPMPTRRN